MNAGLRIWNVSTATRHLDDQAARRNGGRNWVTGIWHSRLEPVFSL